MNLFFSALNSVFNAAEARMPNVERRESGPKHLDRTSDEWFEPESEVTDERVEWSDSMFQVVK